MPFLNNIGSTELVIIGIVLLVLFGGKKLSELARGIGESGRELRKVKKDMIDAYNQDEDKKEAKQAKKKKGGVDNV
jgi:sec-independent protein translocase protein TatA